MDLNFPVQAKIQMPVEEVFDAVYDPKKLSAYFTTAGASDSMDEGKKVMWEFADFPGPFPIYIKQVTKNERIIFEWEANDGEGKGAGYNTKVEMTFTLVDRNSTLVQIVESGWKDSEKSFKAAVGNSQGWMAMICFLKAYLEYGVILRKGFF